MPENVSTETPVCGRSGKLEHGMAHIRATLEHVVRDPAIAQHAGWQQDAKAALEWLDRAGPSA